MRTHYLPQWLLRQFENEQLIQVDLASGERKIRTPYSSGYRPNMWEEGIEKGLMGIHDNSAADIFYKFIQGKDRIILPVAERLEFAKWLAVMIPRVPNTTEHIKQMLKEANENPEIAVHLLHQRRESLLDRMRKRNPKEFASAEATWGKVLWEDFLMTMNEMLIRTKQVNYIPSEKEVYNVHLKDFDPPKYARILCHYQWVWLYRPNGFIIGDNPLIRWHRPKSKHNAGVNQSNVEVTMPLSSHLCLLMRKRWKRYDGTLVRCSARQSRVFNRRQKLAAISFVYYGSWHKPVQK